MFYLAFLVLNAKGGEVQRYNNYENPSEVCNNIYENRIYQDDFGHQITRCIKLGIPDNTIYEKSCEELHLKSDELLKKC